MCDVYSLQPFPFFEIFHTEGDDMCTVVFYTSVHTEVSGEEIVHVATALTVCVEYAPDLYMQIRNQYRDWLELASETRMS